MEKKDKLLSRNKISVRNVKVFLLASETQRRKEWATEVEIKIVI